MGFDRSQCEAALTAAFYNNDRAVEYLLNGIPQTLPSSGQGEEGEEGDEDIEGEEGGDSAQIEHLFRTLIASNPVFG